MEFANAFLFVEFCRGLLGCMQLFHRRDGGARHQVDNVDVAFWGVEQLLL